MEMSSLKPGFDGDTFGVERIRDHDGKGRRELVRRVRYDVVERLFRYSPPLIDLPQREAAVKLQCDWQLAQTPVTARIGSLGTGRHDFGLCEAVMDAAEAVRGAKRFVGLQWPIVECVVLGNIGLARTAKMFRIEQLRVLPRLRAGLDLLAQHYGMA